MSPLSQFSCRPAVVVPYVLLAISLVGNFYLGVLLSRSTERGIVQDEPSYGRHICPCPSDVKDVGMGGAGVEPQLPSSPDFHHPRALASSGRRTSGDSKSSDSANHGHHQHDALFFLFNMVLLGTAILHISSLLPAMQFTVMLFVLGMIVSLFMEGLDLKGKSGIVGVSYQMWMDIDPHLLIFTMLPCLLAGDAMNIDTSVAKRVAKQCLYLAGPGVMISAMTVAVFLKYYMKWEFLLALVTAAILCATDPVAVVALLKELGASPMLTVQIQGESLLNDGTAIVLYTLAYEMLGGKTYDFSEMMMFIVKKVLMACALGAFLGYVFFSWLRAANDRFNHSSTVIQILLTISAAYWSFIISEGSLEMSGVLATVASSLVLAHHMWPHMVSHETLTHFWHTLEDLMNIIIFLLGGALCGAAMVHIKIIDYLHLLVIYFVLLAVRGSLIFGSRPLLRMLSHDNLPVSLSDAAVMTWGGLRGAVGLALAIQVRRGRAPDSNGNPKIEVTEADRVLFFVSGIAFLTTVVNATTAPVLVQELGITALPEVQEQLLRKFNQQLVNLSAASDNPPEVTKCLKDMLHHIEEDLHERSVKTKARTTVHQNLQGMKSKLQASLGAKLHSRRSKRSVHADTDFTVKAFQAVHAVFNSIPDEDKMRLDHLPCQLHELDKGSQELIELVKDCPADEEMCKVVNKTMMSLVYTNYQRQIQSGDLRPGSPETDVLFTSIRVCLSPLSVDLRDLDFVMHTIADAQGIIGHVSEEHGLPPELKNQYRHFGRSIRFSLHGTVGQASASLSNSGPVPMLMNPADSDLEGEIIPLGWTCKRELDKIVKSHHFAMACVAAIMLNAVYVVVDELARDVSNDKHIAWLVTEWMFCTIFTAEAVIKIIAAPCGYWKDSWNKFDFSLVILGIFGAITSTMSFASTEQMGSVEGSSESRVIRIAKVLRTMRFLRIFRLFHARLSAEKFVSKQLAVCMHKIQTLNFFVHAHILAQGQLKKYFMGDADEMNEVEIARCILQSMASVHKALISVISVQRTMESELLDELRWTKERKRITENLEAFVQSAAVEGAINSREAHAIMHPMHVEIARCLQVINKRTDGVVALRESQRAPGPAPITKALTTFISMGAKVKAKNGENEVRKTTSMPMVSSSPEDEDDRAPRRIKKLYFSDEAKGVLASRVQADTVGAAGSLSSDSCKLGAVGSNEVGSRPVGPHQADSAGGFKPLTILEKRDIVPTLQLPPKEHCNENVTGFDDLISADATDLSGSDATKSDMAVNRTSTGSGALGPVSKKTTKRRVKKKPDPHLPARQSILEPTAVSSKDRSDTGLTSLLENRYDSATMEGILEGSQQTRVNKTEEPLRTERKGSIF